MALFIRVKVPVPPPLGEEAAPLSASLPWTRCCAGSHTQELVLPQGDDTNVGERGELGMPIGKVGKPHRMGRSKPRADGASAHQRQVTDGLGAGRLLLTHAKVKPRKTSQSTTPKRFPAAVGTGQGPSCAAGSRERLQGRAMGNGLMASKETHPRRSADR